MLIGVSVKVRLKGKVAFSEVGSLLGQSDFMTYEPHSDFHKAERSKTKITVQPVVICLDKTSIFLCYQTSKFSNSEKYEN